MVAGGEEEDGREVVVEGEVETGGVVDVVEVEAEAGKAVEESEVEAGELGVGAGGCSLSRVTSRIYVCLTQEFIQGEFT